MKKHLILMLVLLLTWVTSAYAQEEEQSSKVKFRGLETVDTFEINFKRNKTFSGEDREGKEFGVNAKLLPIEKGRWRYGAAFRYLDGNTQKDVDGNMYSDTDYTIVGGGLEAHYAHTDGDRTKMGAGIMFQETETYVPRWNYRSRQDETQLYARLQHFFDMKIKSRIFPTEAGAEFVYPLESSIDYWDSDGNGEENAYDNQRLNAWFRTELYKTSLDDKEKWNVTFLSNLGLGYLWGKDSGYFSIGPEAKLTAYGRDLVEVGAGARWLFDGPDRWYTLLSLKPYNMVLAGRAAMVTKYSSGKYRTTQ